MTPMHTTTSRLLPTCRRPGPLRALGAADEVVVLDVYFAREAVDPQLTGAFVADAVPLPDGAVEFVANFDDVAGVLHDRARPGDVVITLGAGDITNIGPRVIELLGD